MTILVAPMIIGIAVDDTVHYIVHFKQEFAACGSYHEANRATFGKVGKAIVFTSVILTIGFSIFGLSIVKSMLHIAVLSSVGILSALAADLFITPVLFVLLRPFEKRVKTPEREPLTETMS
jgi:predicted RND superfamily exporter protein